MNSSGPATIWTPNAGDLVCCSYRLPTPRQFWVHPVHIGVIRQPGDDPPAWNARNREWDFRVATGRLPVEYLRPGKAGGFPQHDSIDSLFPVLEGKAAPWMVRDEDEAWDVVFRGYTSAARHHRERAESLGLALEWSDRLGSPLHRFGSTRMVQDEGHRVALLAEVEGCSGRYEAEAARRPPVPAGRDVQLAALVVRLEDLAGVMQGVDDRTLAGAVRPEPRCDRLQLEGHSVADGLEVLDATAVIIPRVLLALVHGATPRSTAIGATMRPGVPAIRNRNRTSRR